jgi:hypothetical protein
LDIVEEALAAPQLISSTAQKHKIPRQTVQTWVSQARATGTQLLKSELLDHGHSGALYRQKQPQRSGRQPDVAREQAVELAQEVITRRNQNLSTSSRWFRRVAGIKRTKGEGNISKGQQARLLQRIQNILGINFTLQKAQVT